MKSNLKWVVAMIILWIEILMENNNSLLCGCIFWSQSNDFDKNECIESIKEINKLI